MQKPLRHLVILGAGASHDFAHPISRGGNSDPIFPLTNGLVQGRYIDRQLIGQYEGAKVLLSRIVSCVQKGSFEKCLENWKSKEQLDALRLYLGDLFWHLSNAKMVMEQSTNNFLALVDYIRGTPEKGAYVVSFNYDVLLENTLGIKSFVQMGDYINRSIENYAPDNIKLIKMHGSCDWYYLIRKDYLPPSSRLGTGYRVFSFPNRKDSVYEYLKKFPIDTFPTDSIHTQRILEGTRQSEDYHRIPAIAVPMTGPKSHVCPIEHIHAVRDGLDYIEKILVIGWKAADPFLLDMLHKHLKNPISLTVVSGSKQGADEVAKEMSKFIPTLRSTEIFEGFSNFIGGSSECDAFFS